MVDATSIVFYKSNNNGLGGAIDTSQPVIPQNFNNLMPFVNRADQQAGATHYSLMYAKNTSAEKIKKFSFRLAGGTPSSLTDINWAKGLTGKNGSEQSIGSITTAPSGLTWIGTSDYVELSDLNPNDIYGIWIRWIIQAGVPDMKNDNGFFRFKFNPISGGTGSSGDPSGGGTGGSGGNAPGSIPNYKVAVTGDWGCESETDTVMKMCQSYDWLISTGDNAYAKADCFLDRVTKYGLKNKGSWAYGNHEYEESGGKSPYINYFGGGTYFYKTIHNMAIITIDSNIDMDIGSNQHDRIKEFLERAKNDPKIDWIVANWHHPMFGSSSKHSYNDGNSVQAFMNLFLQYKVSFVFNGHNHNWQRSRYVKRSGDAENPDVVDSSSPFTNDGTGLIEVIVGTGGHDDEGSLYSLGSQPSFMGFQNNSNLGIYELAATNNGQTLTCRFKATDGDVFDTITYNQP